METAMYLLEVLFGNSLYMLYMQDMGELNARAIDPRGVEKSCRHKCWHRTRRPG